MPAFGLSKPEAAQIHKLIETRGRLSSQRKTYLQRHKVLFGSHEEIPASSTIAAKLAGKPGLKKPNSTIVGAAGLPEGFGNVIQWAPEDVGLAAVAFLNTGDPMGLMVTGVRTTDTIEFVHMDGLASFAEDIENEHVSAIIGIVGAGAGIGAATFGAPEAAPGIAKATEFAQSMFKEKKVKTKVRDVFGQDPSSGGHAEQEGGVIVSLPAARTTYYSGNSDHKERWIKKPGFPRDRAHRPDHAEGAFFLQPGTDNRKAATTDGNITLCAWDFAFGDNFGFYRLHILLKRGSGKFPDVE
jgi:hypothetical protein